MPRKRGSGALDRLLDVVRDAEDWPVAGSAVRRMADAETWALIELKQRLDALDDQPGAPRDVDRPAPPAEMLADLVRRSRGIDPDAALDALYRQTLSQLVPDQAAMLDVLSERRVAPLCHLGASRLPAGPVSFTVLSNASSLGREAGVLLREYVPQYMTHMLALGLLRAGPEHAALEDEYELLMADTQLRDMRSHVRGTLRLYPRTLRASVSLSDYGQALWRDCRPAADTLLRQGRY